MCASECMAGETAATERGDKKVPQDYKDKSICFVNKPNADNMTYLLSAFMLQIRIHGELFWKSIIFHILNSALMLLFKLNLIQLLFFFLFKKKSI